MITGVASAGSYLRPAQTSASKTTFTPADALPAAAADESAAAEPARPGIPISSVQKLDMSGLKIISIRDVPEIRDRWAAGWLDMQAAQARAATEVPDNAPQNTYATVKVNGKVVATLYNGGSSAMTNQAAAMAGDMQDPPGLGGPDLAQWRAERIAQALGGTIEKASTAITQAEWKPRESVATNYTRAQLDAAFEAMMAAGQKPIAQRPSPYAPAREAAGVYTDFGA